MSIYTNLMNACTALDKANANLIKAKARYAVQERETCAEMRSFLEPRWSDDVLSSGEYKAPTLEIIEAAQRMSPLNRNLFAKIIRDASTNLYGETVTIDVETGRLVEPEERTTVYKAANVGQVVSTVSMWRRKTLASMAKGIVPKSLLRKVLAELKAAVAEIEAELNA